MVAAAFFEQAQGEFAAMAIFAVPWMAADAAVIGWWFRWSGAWAAGGIFQLCGLAVTRAGISLQLEDQPLAVDSARRAGGALA